MIIGKIISGSQTGADRAGLDAAIACNVSHGGWCPKGRKALDGPLPPHYQLCETPSAAYPQRTEWNVRESDGAVIFTLAEELSGGSLKTKKFAQRHQTPFLHISHSTPDPEIALAGLSPNMP